MLKRKIYKRLIEWKNDESHKPLLIRGARQVGKTFIVDQFGKNEYKSYIKLNFMENDKLRSIFDGDLKSENILAEISLRINDVNFIPNDTLIFFDEIQCCPRARTALKFLYEDKRHDYIASGSLLGIRYKDFKENNSIPVGYETDIDMYSLDFEEFLLARGVNKDAIKILNKYFIERIKVPNDINELYMKYFKEYMCIGGMPEVVETFINTSNYQAVHKKQEEILKNYKDDVLNYAENNVKKKIISCYESIPSQLSKDYTKFKYSLVEKQGTLNKLENAIDWLIESGLVKKVNNVSMPEFPLKSYEKLTEFKLYLTDIGLLTCMFGFKTQSAILTDNLKSMGKGGMFENAVFVCIMQSLDRIYYYKNEDSTQEIEFIFENSTEVLPLEVKAKNGGTISLNNFINKYKPSIAYKVVDGNIGEVEHKLTIPYYMLLFIENTK